MNKEKDPQHMDYMHFHIGKALNDSKIQLEKQEYQKL